MLILPEIWPDETIYSLFAKIARINGLRDFEATRILAGEERPISVIGCPVNIKHFCEATKGAYGSPYDLLRHTTVFPALAHLGVLSPLTLAEVCNGTKWPELGILEFGVGRGHYWRFCRECAEQDERNFGVAYWHRSHQLPTSQYCTEHRLRLGRVNLRRVQLHENFILPFEVSTQIEDGDSYAECDRVCFEISVLGREALADKSAPFSQDTILAVYRASLVQMGLLNATGKVCLTEYFKKFGQQYDVQAVSIASLLHQTKVSNPRQLLYGITNELECRPFARALLVRWFFGTWAIYKEQCRWQDVFGGGANSVGAEGAKLNEPSFEAMLQKNRQVCLNYKISHISPTRLEFMGVSCRAFRWLRQNDRMWLDEELPMRSRVKGQKRLFE